MEAFYYVIEYEITFLSDFHIGAGITLLGGNLHGLRLDENGFPYMPPSQVRGLLKWGGRKLASWKNTLAPLFMRNFSETQNREKRAWWSFTRAAFEPAKLRGWGGAENAELLGVQSHIRCKEEMAERLFSYQKGKGTLNTWPWIGTIYSVEPAQEIDTAFLVTCMRAEDRIGARRSRGYGKIDWRPSKIRRYKAKNKGLEDRPPDLDFWVNRLFESGDK